MNMPSLGFIELILVFGAVLAFGFWELYTLRRDRKHTEATRKARPKTDHDGD